MSLEDWNHFVPCAGQVLGEIVFSIYMIMMIM